MINVGNLVKVIRPANIDGPKEYIPIGTICKVIEIDKDCCAIRDLNNPYSVEFWYKEDELEKGILKWIPENK